MKCIETRKRANGAVYRRYARVGLPALATLEVPISVLRALGMKKIEHGLEVWRRGEAARLSAAKLKATVLARAGWKATAVAHDLNITEARVRQIRKELAK